jgi:glycosyltransferase involved in cell wall biosynthesis
MKEICLVSQYWYPDINGDVTRLNNVIESLRKFGFKITLITTIPHYPKGDKKGYKNRLFKIENGEIRIIRVFMPSIEHKGFSKRLILYLFFSFLATFPILIYGKKYVWIFSQRVFTTFSAIPAKFLHRTKIFSDITDIWPEALVNTGYAKNHGIVFKIGRFIAKVSYRISDCITTLTPRMKEIFVKEYGVSMNKVFILPNVAKRLPLKERKGISKKILFYGNLGSNYDFKSILELAKFMKEFKFIIKGTGEELESVKNEILKNKIENVELITDYLDEEELAELISEADAFILALKKQVFKDVSFPIKFVEYVCNGKPIIYIGDEDHVYELVNKYKLGIALKREEMLKAIDSLEMIIKYEQNGKNELAEKYFDKKNLDRYINQFINSYIR